MRKLVLICIILFSLSNIRAQTINGDYYQFGRYAWGYSMIEASSGHYYLGGIFDDRSSGARDMQIVIVKTMINGDTLWTRQIGDSDYDELTKLLETSDGTLLVIGRTSNNSAGKQDYLYMRMSPEGEILWQHTYGFQDWDFACDVVENNDGSFYITGISIDPEDKNFVALIKLDAQGNLINEYRYYHYLHSRILPNKMLLQPNGDVLVAGEERFGGFLDSSNTAILRISPENDTVWTYFSKTNGRDLASSMIQFNDTAFIICGNKYDSSLEKDVPFSSMFNTDGEIIWEMDYPQYKDHSVVDLIKYFNNTYLLNGIVNGAPDNSKNIWIAQIDHLGNLLSYSSFELPYDQFAKASILSSDNQIAICAGAPKNKDELFSLALFKIQPLETVLPDTISLVCGTDSLLNPQVGYFGNQELSYSWSPKVGLDAYNSPNPVIINLDSSLAYTVTISDGLIEIVDSIQVNILPLEIEALWTESLICGDTGRIETMINGDNSEYSFFWVSDEIIQNPTEFSPRILPSVSSFYTLTVSDGLCSDTDSIWVEVNNPDYELTIEPFEASFTAPPFVAAFQNITPDLGKYDFLWYFGDGDSLLSNEIIVQHEYLNNGLYDVSLIASRNKCTDTLIKEDFISCSGGSWPVSNTPEKADLPQIYPNPVNENMPLRIDFGKAHIEYRIELFNTAGHILYTTLSSDIITVLQAPAIKGIYFIKIFQRDSFLCTIKLHVN